MAVKKPLVLYNGIVSEVQSGDTLSTSAPASVTRITTRFSATLGQTAFTIPAYTVGQNLVDVELNGSDLDITTDFTETNSTTITLASACIAGDIVKIVAYYPDSVTDHIGQETALAYSIAL